MRAFIIILGVLLVTCLVSSSPIDPKRWLVNRPSGDVIFGRVGPQRLASLVVKGGRAPIAVKGRSAPPAVKGGIPHFPPLSREGDPSRPLEFQVTKGEYVCGNRICRLTPGVVPEGCDQHPCQYPIAIV